MVPELTADISTLAAPGSLLKQKRIELGWPVEKVAKLLLLSSTQIESIERDDYADLPGATYVLGYWRSYSGLMNLNIEESIDLHKGQLRNPLSAITLEANHQKARGHQEKNRKRSAFVFLILSALFLSVIWVWQNPEDNPFSQWVDNLSNTHLAKLNAQDSPSEQAIKQEIEIIVPDTAVDQSVTLPEPNFSSEDSSGTEVVVSEIVKAEITEAESAIAVADSVVLSSEVEPDLTVVVSEPTDTALVASNEQIASILESQPVSPDTGNETLVHQDNSNELSSLQPIIATESNQPQALPVIVDQSAVSGLANSTEEPQSGGLVNINQINDIASEGAAVETSTVVDAGQQDPAAGVDVGSTLQTDATNGELNPQGDFDSLSPRGLELLVEQETWIDVRDVTGEKLIYQTVESGQRLQLTGEPPFYVFIGTSSGVSVNYLGNRLFSRRIPAVYSHDLK